MNTELLISSIAIGFLILVFGTVIIYLVKGRDK